jgi:hypothetical protein
MSGLGLSMKVIKSELIREFSLSELDGNSPTRGREGEGGGRK